MPDSPDIQKSGFTRVLYIFLLALPLVSLNYRISLAFLEGKAEVKTNVFIYDYREIYAGHLKFKKWWGNDSLLLFSLKKYYWGVLRYEKPDTGDQTYNGLYFLESFFHRLNEKNSQVRIAYYGDSGIEADLVTQTLRDSLQKNFGGTGVGFLPITSRDPGYRQSIHHYFSNLWRWETLENPSPMRKNPGISGNTFYSTQNDSIAEARAWISYRGKSFSPRTAIFPTLRFFYGKNENEGSNGNIEWEINGLQEAANLVGNGLLNELRLFDQPVTQIRIKANIPSGLPVYGCSIESETGVILDNFALRGIDGSRLIRIPKGLLAEFQRKLNYDLLIFSYGLNLINAGQKAISAYEEKINRLMKHYRQAFPGVPILLIGPPDKGLGSPGNIVSDPHIPAITKVMRKAAITNEVAFISLYELMGGNGSMARWVEKERPRLASTDYTHFNLDGADKISREILNIFLLQTNSLQKSAFN
jgi:lysophospholipase L1-like esterase